MDELLNAMLFLLIGFETLAVGTDRSLLPTALHAIAFALLACGVSVAIPMGLLRVRSGRSGQGIAVLIPSL